MARFEAGQLVQVKSREELGREFVYDLCEDYELVCGRVMEVAPYPQTGVLVDVGIELYFDENELRSI